MLCLAQVSKYVHKNDLQYVEGKTVIEYNVLAWCKFVMATSCTDGDCQ